MDFTRDCESVKKYRNRVGPFKSQFAKAEQEIYLHSAQAKYLNTCAKGQLIVKCQSQIGNRTYS